MQPSHSAVVVIVVHIYHVRPATSSLFIDTIFHIRPVINYVIYLLYVRQGGEARRSHRKFYAGLQKAVVFAFCVSAQYDPP